MRRLLTSLAFALALSARAETITSVTFSGTAANPTITVFGTGFGMEPAGNNSPFTTYGLTGENFGAGGLFIIDVPTPFAAGQNTPTSVDSIGLTNVSYSDTVISFQFGSGYDNLIYSLAEGDAFYLQVKDIYTTGNVHYTSSNARPVTATPEPAELLLTMTGLFGIGAVAMRRRFQASAL